MFAKIHVDLTFFLIQHFLLVIYASTKVENQKNNEIIIPVEF